MALCARAHKHVHCNVKSRDLFLKFKFKTYPAMAACSCTNGRGVNKYSWTIQSYHLSRLKEVKRWIRICTESLLRAIANGTSSLYTHKSPGPVMPYSRRCIVKILTRHPSAHLATVGYPLMTEEVKAVTLRRLVCTYIHSYFLYSVVFTNRLKALNCLTTLVLLR